MGGRGRKKGGRRAEGSGGVRTRKVRASSTPTLRSEEPYANSLPSAL